jgi:FAD-linked oxidoreductase
VTITRRRALALGAGAAGGVLVGAGVARQLRLDREPPAPPVADATGRLLWRNWSGIQSSYPALRAAPASEDALAEQLRQAPAPIRPVGAGHSFTGLVPTAGTLLSLDALHGVIDQDTEQHRATVWAGTRLGDLGPALVAIGQEMRSLPDINKQSLGGAIGTGTHGTGGRYPAIHGDVQAFRLITPAGDVLDCSAARHPEVFAAARVGLGAFGVITRVTLQNRPLSRVRKRVYLQPLLDITRDWPRLTASHDKVEFFAFPFSGLAAVITTDPTDAPLQPRGPDQDTDTLLSLKRLRDVLGPVPAVRRWLTAKLMSGLPPEESVDDSWKLLSNERPVRFNEMEFHLPRETQMQALTEVMAIIERGHDEVFFPLEVRSIAPDDAWLSPFYGRESGSIAVHAFYKDDYRRLFAAVEPVLRRHGGRPHWGKLHTLRAADLAALYPRWRDAMDVRQSLDPEGRMLNDHLRRLFVDG